MSQGVGRAGFYQNGTITASVTKAITSELEKAQATRLGERIVATQDRTLYKRWAWEACNDISGQFLQSPPDHFGYLEDTTFQVAIATYLEQPCPLMAVIQGRFFGKKGQVIDKYSANLAAAILPGGGHRILHNQLQSFVQAMMKLA